jgi:acyl carrier protein
LACGRAQEVQQNPGGVAVTRVRGVFTGLFWTANEIRPRDTYNDGNANMSSLKELQDLIKEKYGLDAAALEPTASMRASGVDSLALVEFIFEVEDKFGINVPDTSANLDTLAELAAIVDSLRAAEPATEAR